MELFCGNFWQNPKITAVVHYCHYNSHRHYHYHHFHYPWKMHLYRLKILLTILFIVIWSPICFNLSSFYRHIFFSSLIPNFYFYAQQKDSELVTTIRHILDVLFIPFTYIYSYLRLLTLREKCPNRDQKKLRIWTLT